MTHISQTEPRAPFNQGIHECLTALGYQLCQLECTFEDTGDAESGPCLEGHPAVDEYSLREDTIYVVDGGSVDHREDNPYWDAPEWVGLGAHE